MPKGVRTGRPTQWTQELEDQIIDGIISGLSLKKICEPEDMPHVSAVYRWMWHDPRFENIYSRALETKAHALVEEMVSIADESDQDWDETEKGPRFNPEHVQRSRLRVDTRRWIASKYRPKQYGDNLQLTGKDGKDLVPETVTVFALPSNGRDKIEG